MMRLTKLFLISAPVNHLVRLMRDYSFYKPLDISIKSLLLCATFLFPLSTYSYADTRLGMGIGILYGQPDFIFTVRPEMSHWAYGFRLGYNEVETEGFGFDTKEEETFTGPIAYYLIEPEARGTFYGSVGLYRWSLTHSAPQVNESDTVSTSAIFIGGGYTKWLNESIYYDVGISLGVGSKLYAETSVSSVDQTGGLEGRLILGISLDQ